MTFLKFFSNSIQVFSLHLHIMDTKAKDSSFFKTCLCGIVTGFITYSGSFAVIPILSTIVTLIFGTKSWITIFVTAFGQLTAGYLITHSAKSGIAVSAKIFGGLYTAKVEMRNKRIYDETRWQALKRFFISAPLNALVMNLIWETFTIFYLLHTVFYLRYIHSPLPSELGPRLILLTGFSRYFAGCLSGMSTGLINQLWERYLSHRKYAIFNTDIEKLKLKCKDRKKLLSPTNMENWIGVSAMIIGALFTVASNIPNRTGLHLLDIREKKLITDILVMHGGWIFFRDGAMLLFIKPEKAPKMPLIVNQPSIPVDESKMLENAI